MAEVVDGAGDIVRLRRLRRFARWMDDGVKLPGIPLRVGLDPIIGLVPGLGDAAGAVLSAWILVEAVRFRASRATLARMVYNVAADAIGGALPLLGDLFDAVWKANLRNVALLERHLAEPARAAKADRRFAALLIGAVLLLCAALAAAGGLFLAAVVHFIAGH
jgi:Domain of unknown function (DUF4112)